MVPAHDDEALMEAVYSRGPLAVTIDAAQPGFRFYSGGTRLCSLVPAAPGCPTCAAAAAAPSAGFCTCFCMCTQVAAAAAAGHAVIRGPA